ncbi:cupin [Halobacteriales archaeon QS_6_71_20]|nr:MAG: cupin [Halobacteriales archaeon QS_6_71_20]
MNHTTLGDPSERTVRLADALDTDHIAVNRYRIPPGDSLPGGLHAHPNQEEVFVVVAGVARFETLGGEVRVAAGEAVRFAPGEYQSGANDGDEPLVAIALGAPRDSDDVRVPATCPACGTEGLRLGAGGSTATFACPECDAEHEPSPCPACGGTDLGFTTDAESRPVVECGDCGARFADAPIRE